MFLLYIDPGSGNLLFQLLLSMVVTFGIFFKQTIAFIRAIFSKKK